MEKAKEVKDVHQHEDGVLKMADKFLDSGDLEKIKEEIKMTRLGTMLYEDGIEVGMEREMERGMERGIERGEKQKLKSLIDKKLKRGYAVDEIADMLEEDVEEVRQLITEL